MTSDRLAPHIGKNNLVFVDRLSRKFIEGDVVVYKEGKKSVFVLAAETHALNEKHETLLVSDDRGKEFQVPLNKIYGRAIFGNSRPKIKVPEPERTLSLTNYDQGLSDAAIEELRAQDLSHIDLTDSALNEEVLQLISQKKNLKKLSLGRTIGSKAPSLTDDMLRIIADCRTLETIRLHGHDITDNGIRHLANLPHLKKLQLGGTQVSGSGLGNLDNLRWLRLDATPITDQDLQTLS